MKITADYINFGNTIKTRQGNNTLIKEEFNDNNVRILYEEKDIETDRFIRQNKWDDNGNPIQKWWFEYNKDKQIEHFEAKGKESYTRTMIEKIVDGLKVRTESYISKTNPKNNYIHVITKDSENKMISFICNGKRVL